MEAHTVSVEVTSECKNIQSDEVLVAAADFMISPLRLLARMRPTHCPIRRLASPNCWPESAVACCYLHAWVIFSVAWMLFSVVFGVIH